MIKRTKERVKKTGEVFTPPELVREMVSQIDNSILKDPTKTFLDPTCGDGNILVEILKIRIENGVSPTDALKTLYGVELMEDNTIRCRKRLLDIVGNTKEHRKIVSHNIANADALTFSYWKKSPLSSFLKKKKS